MRAPIAAAHCRMRSREPPAYAAFRHHTARSGFEVVFLRATAEGVLCQGSTTAIEADQAFCVDYEIELDPGWRTRRAQVRGRTRAGQPALQTTLETDGYGDWLVDGRGVPELRGCLDVDLESSAFTNALPVHRLALAVGTASDAPAAYVRAVDLSVERLEQRYARLADDGSHVCFDYAAPRFDFACRLVYDAFGLVLDYPGLATRVA